MFQRIVGTLWGSEMTMVLVWETKTETVIFFWLFDALEIVWSARSRHKSWTFVGMFLFVLRVESLLVYIPARNAQQGGI